MVIESFYSQSRWRRMPAPPETCRLERKASCERRQTHDEPYLNGTAAALVPARALPGRGTLIGHAGGTAARGTRRGGDGAHAYGRQTASSTGQFQRMGTDPRATKTPAVVRQYHSLLVAEDWRQLLLC